MDVKHIMGDVEDHRLRKDLRSSQHVLVDSEIERARHKVVNYYIRNLNEKSVQKKLDHFFNNLKCAAIVNLAFEFILRNTDDGEIRYFYAHENNTQLD